MRWEEMEVQEMGPTAALSVRVEGEGVEAGFVFFQEREWRSALVSTAGAGEVGMNRVPLAKKV
jgi:hypothetical protein